MGATWQRWQVADCISSALAQGSCNESFIAFTHTDCFLSAV